MRRISMLLLAACSLAAQSPYSSKQDFHKDLSHHKFNVRPSVRMPEPQRMWITPEMEDKTCSIPLLSINPPSRRGKITTIQPKTRGNMPNVKMPAPPCKGWPTE